MSWSITHVTWSPMLVPRAGANTSPYQHASAASWQFELQEESISKLEQECSTDAMIVTPLCGS